MMFRTRRTLIASFAFALVAAQATAQTTAPQEIENVAAFARLYGAARWFYPSDAAATLDWNRFAIEGVRRVRGARSTTELATTLEQLFTPLGPGIAISTSLPPKSPRGVRNAALVAWHYRGPAIAAGTPGPYTAKRMNRTVAAPTSQPNAFAVLMQSVRADTLRGKTIRLRGQMRVTNPNSESSAGLWLRVDRAQQAMGFFDNMADRPVRDTAWREYVITGAVDSDATQIAFGVINSGSMTVDVDALELATRDVNGKWIPLAIPDASFEADSNNAVRGGWAQNQTTVTSRPNTGAVHGTRFARIEPAATAMRQASIGMPADSLETPVTGASVDVELSGGLKARVPLSLTDTEARTELPALATLRTAIASSPSSGDRDNTDTRLADIVIAWNVFRHFYPYWGDIDVNWDARLRPQLETALRASASREAHVDAVRMLVADLNDGHGNARDVATPPRATLLPLQFRILAGQLVVTASTNASIPVGSVVTRINGTSASTRIATEMQLASGTPQWKRTRTEGALLLCPRETTTTLTIEPPSGPARDASLPCVGTITRATESRPDSIAELQPGVWYVDLTRVKSAQLSPMLATLAKARGVVFDVRGYPTDAGAMVLPYLMRESENANDRWMHVPRFAAPFGEVAGWQDFTWSLQPATPAIAGQRVFLTDGRAISYAESVMGYVRDYKLGTIIGGATAGANGNVASFSVPGGIAVTFTGMRVTRHDGTTRYHTAGVAPEIALEPTLAGIRAGTDELLARALAALRVQP